MEVKVYSIKSCHWCEKVRDFLKMNKVVFEEINVEGNQDATKAMIKASKQMGVPVIVAGESVVVGFDEKELKKALKL